jgi:hypothetical protein
LKIETKIVSSHTADAKPVKQEVNGTSPFSIPWPSITLEGKAGVVRCSNR